MKRIAFLCITLIAAVSFAGSMSNPGGVGIALPSANKILGVNAGGTSYEGKTLTAGSNVTITNGVGTITIDASGGGGGGSSFDTPIVDTSPSNTFTVGTGAGTGGASFSDGGKIAGYFDILVGTSPAANSIVCHVDFPSLLPTSGSLTVVLQPTDALGAAALSTMWVIPTFGAGGFFSGFTLRTSTALSAGNEYVFNYSIVSR